MMLNTVSDKLWSVDMMWWENMGKNNMVWSKVNGHLDTAVIHDGETCLWQYGLPLFWLNLVRLSDGVPVHRRGVGGGLRSIVRFFMELALCRTGGLHITWAIKCNSQWDAVWNSSNSIWVLRIPYRTCRLGTIWMACVCVCVCLMSGDEGQNTAGCWW